MSGAERTQLEALASDLPRLWNSPQTSLTDKRQVVRLLLERVTVWAPPESNQIAVECHWSGGEVTRHQVRRPARRWQQLAEYGELLKRVESLRASGWTSARIAGQLTADGFLNPRGGAITAANVRQLVSREQARRERRRPKK